MPCSTIIRTRKRPASHAGKPRPFERRGAKALAASTIAERHRSRFEPHAAEGMVPERSTVEIREVVQRLAKHDMKVSLELKAAVGMLYQVARLSELAAEHGNSAVAVSNLGAVTLHLESVCARWCAR